MESYYTTWIVFLVLVTICPTRELSDDDIDLLIANFKSCEYDGFPPVDVIMEGTVKNSKGKRRFNLLFMAEDGQKCKSNVSLFTDGSGSHSWSCDNKPWKGENDASDESSKRGQNMKARGRKTSKGQKKKKPKKFKRKGSGKNKVKRGSKNGGQKNRNCL